MKSLPSAHQIRSSQRGFTLVELILVGSLMGVLGLVVFGVLRSGTILTSQNAGINISASRARLALDQIGDRTRYAMEPPTLVTATGSAATGTTADGIIIKRLLGTPYVIKEPLGTSIDIQSTAKQFCVEFNSDLPAPVVGDFMLMESISRPELEISAVAPMISVGAVQRRLITTTTAIGELARPSYYRVGGFLYRKEAYIFVANDTASPPRFDLRHFSRVVGATTFAAASEYVVEANSYRRLTNQAFFTNATTNGADSTSLRAMVNSSNKSEYVSRQSAVSTFTAVPIQLKLWSINR